MDGTSSTTETLTQVGPESGAEQPNPFAAIIDNNQNGVDVAASSRGPHENLDQRSLENQMKAMIEMQKARENIASVQASESGAGGENMAGFAPIHGNQTIMNPADQAVQEITSPDLKEMLEMPVAEIASSPVKKMENPKGPWNWSDLHVIRFIRNLEIKAKLDKVVAVVKNVVQAPFKALGRFWRVGDEPRNTVVNSPPPSSQAI